MYANPAMLMQTDEIDSLIQSINKSKDGRHETLLSTLLTLYTSSNSTFILRCRAGAESKSINQPSMTLFGTAVPSCYYESLSERMLSNGFFARTMVFESGPRSTGQDARILDIPERVLYTAKWWKEYCCGNGNLSWENPSPTIVPQDDGAKRLLADMREMTEIEYAKCEHENDEVGTTVWSRVSENIRKLSLLYAISESGSMPVINADAVDWATKLVMYQVKRMLIVSSEHVADNATETLCLKLLRIIRKFGGQIEHHVLLKKMKIQVKEFVVLIETLKQRKDVVIEHTDTATKPKTIYRLA